MILQKYQQLKSLLESTEARFPRAAWRNQDPVEIPWEYEYEDQECVAFITSAMAYGRVSMLKSAVREVLKPLNPHPKTSLLNTKPTFWIDALRNFSYRMTSGPDLVDLFYALQSIYQRYDSLEALYASHKGSHLERLGFMVQTIRNNRLRNECSRGFKYLLTDPTEGSTAKRMHLFSRWMVRKNDEIDLGLWESVSPKELIMPLDTHTSKICRNLGMTNRKSNDLKAALEVTSFLKLLDPNDPLRYDFPLCHIGISRNCLHVFSDKHCPQCPLNLACVQWD